MEDILCAPYFFSYVRIITRIYRWEESWKCQRYKVACRRCCSCRCTDRGAVVCQPRRTTTEGRQLARQTGKTRSRDTEYGGCIYEEGCDENTSRPLPSAIDRVRGVGEASICIHRCQGTPVGLKHGKAESWACPSGLMQTCMAGLIPRTAPLDLLPGAAHTHHL